MEDLLEEIVGLIYDEYDAPADEDADGGSTEIPGDTAAEEVNARWGFEIDPDSFQTIGGFVFGQLGRLPKVGDRVRTANGTLRVVEMDGRRVARLELVGGTETDPGTD
ncbi:MAG: transporter associated domain-containing protein, partial [Gemmatimonadales bacterium]